MGFGAGTGAGAGRGNDGGVLEKSRAYIVKEKEQEQKRDTMDYRAERWATCPLSGEVLRHPVVSDDLGNLMNKEALLTYLMEKRSIPSLAHIRRMRDVFVVGGASGFAAGTPAVFVCPITQLQACGSHAFVALRACGCVLADRAMKEMKGDSCPACGVLIGERDNVVRLVPTEEEADFLRARLKVKRDGHAKGGKAAATAAGEAAAANTSSAAAAAPLTGSACGEAAAGSTAHSASTPAPASRTAGHAGGAVAAAAAAATASSSSSALTGVGAKRQREEPLGGAAGDGEARHAARRSTAPPSTFAAPATTSVSHAARQVRPTASAPAAGAAAGTSRSGLADSAQREAVALIEGQKRTSAVYASLFKPKVDSSGQGVSKSASGAHRW